jgi:hypothetical protein
VFPELETTGIGINWDLANEAARRWAWSYATRMDGAAGRLDPPADAARDYAVD